ncbi:MAG TPA: ABC transporter permease [Thermoanaerobaculia bacterium]|jgi:putative ABC transport system permease protein|nr:ABC transporter permease [Thermoanaerobaculia bacterium]
MSGLLQDVRFALRGLRRTPGFAAVAVATLALGIGANAAMFGIVDRALLRPYPYVRPGELVQVIETWNAARGFGPPSWADFLDWRNEARSFDGMAGYLAQSGNLERRGGPERVRVVESTANLFDVLGVGAALGRTFAPGEDSRGAACVAVLGNPVWRTRFGSDPAAVGSVVRLNGAPCTIVGVAPLRFEFPVGLSDGIWTPLHPDAPIYADRGSHFLGTIARLRPGVSAAAASAEMDGIMRGIARAYPDAARNRGGRVVPFRLWSSNDYRQKLFILSGAVVLVLLIACVNLAGMLLARSTARRRELAIRTALGAARLRLVRQMLVESAVLALAGATAGIAVAAAGAALLSRVIQPYLPRAAAFSPDGRMLLFGLAASGATVLLFGLLPAIRAARAEATTLRGEMAGSPHGLDRLRGALVAGETALSLVLLASAVLLARTLVALARQDPGVATERVVTFKTAPSQKSYPGRGLEEAFYAPVRQRLAAVPGVSAVATINRLPLESWGFNGSFLLEGRPEPADPRDQDAELRVVSPGFYAAIGASMLRGRDFSDADTGNAPPVAVVNDAFVRRYFGADDPLGRRFRFDASSPLITIVGVYRSIRQEGLGRPADPEIDFPAAQIVPGNELYEFGLARTVTFVVRSALPPASLAPAVREAVRRFDPAQPVFGFRTMAEIRDDSMDGDRFALSLVAAFAGIALLLCIGGIYGVMSYFVAQRTRDIGIRMALGATPASILRLVLGSALLLSGAGIGIGLAGSVAAGGVLRSLLFGVRPSDPATLGAAALVLFGTAVAAAYVPARRAAKVDPSTTLRAE